MSENTLVVIQDTETELMVQSLTDSRIAEIEQACSELIIRDLEDKKGYESVRKARIRVKKYRTAVDRRLKAKKKELREQGQALGIEAERLKGKLAPIEAQLTQKEKWFEIETNKRKERQRREALLPERAGQLAAYGVEIEREEILAMSDASFNQKIAELEQEKQEAIRRAQEAEEKRLEEERKQLAAEKAAFEADKRRMVQEALEAAERKEKQEEENRRYEKQGKMSPSKAIELGVIDDPFPNIKKDVEKQAQAEELMKRIIAEEERLLTKKKEPDALAIVDDPEDSIEIPDAEEWAPPGEDSHVPEGDDVGVTVEFTISDDTPERVKRFADHRLEEMLQAAIAERVKDVPGDELPHDYVFIEPEKVAMFRGVDGYTIEIDKQKAGPVLHNAVIAKIVRTWLEVALPNLTKILSK